jgi:hypothetical protein
MAWDVPWDEQLHADPPPEGEESPPLEEEYGTAARDGQYLDSDPLAQAADFRPPEPGEMTEEEQELDALLDY